MYECESLAKTHTNLPLVRLRCSGSNWLPLQQDWSTRWCTVPEGYAASRVHALETRDDDVFVVTYPKCGTTWMQELAWLLLNQLDFERASSVYLRERSIFLEYSGISKHKRKDTIQLCEQLASPRLIKSHLPAQLLPRQVWQHKRKIIYVARNPKDVLVSSYHFFVGLEYWTGDLNTYVDEFINNQLVYSSYWAHIVDFWRLRHEPYVFFVTYEQMKRDLKSVIEKLSKFLDVNSLSAQQLEQLIAHTSFDNMKQSKYANATGLLKETQKTSTDFEFMRRGIVGAFKDELSECQKQKLDKWTADCLREFNLTETDIFGQL